MPDARSAHEKIDTGRPKEVADAARRTPLRELPASGPAFIILHHDEIAAAAHAYYVARGRGNGSADDDWFRAVAHLRRQS